MRLADHGAGLGEGLLCLFNNPPWILILPVMKLRPKIRADGID